MTQGHRCTVSFSFAIQKNATRARHIGVLVPKGASTPKSAYDALLENCSFEQTSMCSTTIVFVEHLRRDFPRMVIAMDGMC